MKTWLKIACIALLMYSAIASLMHPLVPGGLDVDVEALRPGMNTLHFTGYNTHFASDASLQAFISIDRNYYCATEVRALGDQVFAATFNLPDTLPGKNVGFYANTTLDGTVYVSKAIDVSAFEIKNNVVSDCKVNVANDVHQGSGFPFQIIIFESIRNLMWHVPMWFTMFLLMGFSFAWSIRALRQGGGKDSASIDAFSLQKLEMYDLKASTIAFVGVLFCTLGLITGSIWARFTWGSWWTMDPQLNGAMVVFLIYAAYFILRGATPDPDKRARLSAVFNIFAFVMMVVLLMVMPRFVAGLHPGKSGNPAFSSYDLDSSLRAVFYPAVLGWMLLGYWIYSITLRVKKLESDYENAE